ncbi:MAG: ATP-binding protein, partial [Anaerolineae bacterium]
AYDELSALPAAVGQDGIPRFAQDAGAVLPYNNPPIRPAVLAALERLGAVGAEIAVYRDASSRVNQLAALARAADALDELDEYVGAEVLAPERTLLRRVVRQWQRLVIEAGGEVGRVEATGPVANPYVAGNPVTGDLFVGREDILRRLEELWATVGQRPSVVLYGHRRMGKSSILHNLGARFGAHTVVVDFNMQRVGLVGSTGELLYNLALALYDAQTSEVCKTSEVLDLGEPHEQHFTAHNPYTAFDRFLKRLESARGERRFIVTVDEFELIEEMIEGGVLEARLLDFWRGVIQTYQWFVMAFAGLHTLREMTRDYWHPLYGSVTAVPVSFLGPQAARRSSRNPAPILTWITTVRPSSASSPSPTANPTWCSSSATRWSRALTVRATSRASSARGVSRWRTSRPSSTRPNCSATATPISAACGGRHRRATRRARRQCCARWRDPKTACSSRKSSPRSAGRSRRPWTPWSATTWSGRNKGSGVSQSNSCAVGLGRGEISLRNRFSLHCRQGQLH